MLYDSFVTNDTYTECSITDSKANSVAFFWSFFFMCIIFTEVQMFGWCLVTTNKEHSIQCVW